MANKNIMNICHICKEKLEAAGFPAWELYVHVCWANENYKCLVVKGGRTGTGGPLVRWLEKNKFIYSQDIVENFIILKPASLLDVDDCRQRYCNEPHKH